MSQLVRDLFVSDVTRDIPPVVYFHEQSPEKLQQEVAEYIITGGFHEGSLQRQRVPDGIHEQAVRLCTTLAAELDRAGGPDLPNVWISGFYGSGKSSFAKLFGLALDGVSLPSGRSLAEAWLARDTSPQADALRAAWSGLRQRLNDPVAVVFDIGGFARDGEHVHAVAVRALQARLGYSARSPHIALAELELEREGHMASFNTHSQALFGAPWSALNGDMLAPARFSRLMAKAFPEVYRDDRDWHMRHSGAATVGLSPEDAIRAIGDMIRLRRPEATVFFIIDEVSQYVLADPDRVERLRAFASALGAGLKGRAWLFALGQQKLESEQDDSFLVKTKDRFPPRLRVHLAATNIQDVVHRRLLYKRPEAVAALRALFDQHRADLKLNAFGGESIRPDEFVEVYPLLPGHIDLILRLTTALRSRSSRAQGDAQAIRGLLQLLGELFRARRVGERPLGALITLDDIYEVQHTSLDPDTLDSMARVLRACAERDPLLLRVAKAVALLELIQEELPTEAHLVASVLYAEVGQGSQEAAVAEALETLRRESLLGYSARTGYKIQSSEGEQWERERTGVVAPPDQLARHIKDALERLVSDPERPRIGGRLFPWAVWCTYGRAMDDEVVLDPREDASARVQLILTRRAERAESELINRSNNVADPLYNRLVWIAADTAEVDAVARELVRSKRMVEQHRPRVQSLSAARKHLLIQEEQRVSDQAELLRGALGAAFMQGSVAFRGRRLTPTEHGEALGTALTAVANRALPELYPHHITTNLTPAEVMSLLADRDQLTAPSPKLLREELGVLERESGKYVATCAGVVPQRVLAQIQREGETSGQLLLQTLGGPPYGYTVNVVKACVAGLLRALLIQATPESGPKITAPRDAGAKDLFDKDRPFRKATFTLAAADGLSPQDRSRLARLFERHFNAVIESEDNALADAVSDCFPGAVNRLREAQGLLRRLPGAPDGGPTLRALDLALESCIRVSRQTREAVLALRRHQLALSDGLDRLRAIEGELRPEDVQRVLEADALTRHQVSQLREEGAMTPEAEAAAARILTQITSEAPWRGVSALSDDLTALRALYAAHRRGLLSQQQRLCDEARAQVKRREGFATLTGEQSHTVLRPIAEARTETSAEAVAPPLVALGKPWLTQLKEALDESNARLDALLSARRVVRPLSLGVTGREVETEAEVEALLAELRARLMEHVSAGVRVRVV
jgi:hypothetical protein